MKKTAIVCAASKGLGLACAKELAREGFSLAICSRNQDEINAAAQEIMNTVAEINGNKNIGDQTVHPMTVDLSDSSQLPGFYASCKEKLGTISVLVNNVGGPPPSSALETSLEAWNKGFEQIFLSSAVLTQLAAQDMIKDNFGRIISITSLSVKEPIPMLAVSTSMRSAVTAFNKTLATEIAKHNVTVNSVMPGVIHTGRVEFLRRKRAEKNGTTFEQEWEKTINAMPMGRLGTPEELANLVSFLASEKSSYITGMNFAVDGGAGKSWM